MLRSKPRPSRVAADPEGQAATSRDCRLLPFCLRRGVTSLQEPPARLGVQNEPRSAGRWATEWPYVLTAVAVEKLQAARRLQGQ